MQVSDFIAGGAGPLAALQDPASSRWTADQRSGFLLDAVNMMYVEHPETRVTEDYGRAPLLTAPLQTTDDVPVDDMYVVPLAEYVMWKAFGSDAKDDANLKQAGLHQAAYNQFFGAKQ